MLSHFANLRRVVKFAPSLQACTYFIKHVGKFSTSVNDGKDFKNMSEDEWAKRLTPEAFQVCRKAGTELPNTGKYNKFYENGTYSCTCCGALLFSSDTKFNSGSGWPSFYSALPNALEERKDESHGMIRTEVRCSQCAAHLGHVFNDGPQPTGLRYCINSVCLNFEAKDNNTQGEQ